MKLKIDNKAYVDLIGNRRTIAFAINDNVSTTRKHEITKVHEYESRYDLMKAFMVASKSKRISVVADLANTSPIRCKVEKIIEKSTDGTRFSLGLVPIGEKKGVRE